MSKPRNNASQPDKSPTISDIAAAANVSRSTVSRVLTGSTPVAPEKREAVLAAIDRLNFRPNLVARGLVRGRSLAIGVLTQAMTSLYYGELAEGVEQGLRGSGYHPVFASGRWRVESELEALDLLNERQVDALIVFDAQLPDERLLEVNRRTPTVVVGRRVAGMDDRCIWIDNERGVRQAIRHLIALGHRRIAHVAGFDSNLDARERRRCYELALREAGLPFDERLIVSGSFTEQSGVRAMDELLARGVPFSAAFVANDQMAYGARLSLYHHGLRVPEDVSLVGFDDLPSSAFQTPPLTTVRQYMLAVGQAAAEGALRLLAGEPLGLPAFVPELVVRESTRRLA